MSVRCSETISSQFSLRRHLVLCLSWGWTWAEWRCTRSCTHLRVARHLKIKTGSLLCTPRPPTVNCWKMGVYSVQGGLNKQYFNTINTTLLLKNNVSIKHFSTLIRHRQANLRAQKAVISTVGCFILSNTAHIPLKWVRMIRDPVHEGQDMKHKISY